MMTKKDITRLPRVACGTSLARRHTLLSSWNGRKEKLCLAPLCYGFQVKQNFLLLLFLLYIIYVG